MEPLWLPDEELPGFLLLLPEVPLPFVDEPDDLFPPDVLLPEADCDEVDDFLVTFELFDTTFLPEDCDLFCTLFLTISDQCIAVCKW